jgi:F-type H+-transporting ATPase subunit a
MSEVATSAASAAGQAGAHAAPTASEYIVHHLTHWQNKKQVDIVDFSVFNYDSIFFMTLLGIIGSFLLWRAARKATSGVPGRFQAAVEILYEMVDNQAKSIVHNEKSRKLVAPLALTVFVWIFLLNAMDLLPLDLLPEIWKKIYGAAGHDAEHAYLRVVPTADLSVTMGLSLSILLICLFYNMKIKGMGGWAHELISAPFGTSKNPIAFVLLAIVNVAEQLISFVAKTVSHGMRLFGNMYAGELVFMLIALLGGSWVAFEAGSLVLFGMQIVTGWAWAVFHIIIIALQAFVFMMLTLVYIGQSHDAH